MTSYSSLAAALSTNVVELKFSRRRPKSNLSSHRRMLCTLDYTLLNSEKGASILNFKPASGSGSYVPAAKGLIVVWDILKQDWRTVNTESCNIISTISTANPEEFWKYFNTSILPMSDAQKAAFISA